MSAVGCPQRIQSAHVESIDGELCVYDTARQRVHSLNRTAAFVWQRCDGRTAPAELAAALSAEASIDDADSVVQLTLQELAAAQLLMTAPDGVAVVSRRALLRRGVAAAALPAIFSIVAPTPAAAQSVPAGGTATFAFTSADDTFVVPAGVVSITIVANGGQGGLGLAEGVGSTGGTGGLGGRTTATVSVTPGASLTVRVGSGGPNGFSAISTPGGFNGGGGSVADGGGGGGASSVRDGSTPLVVAGGGGGGGGAKGPEVGASGGTGGGLNANAGQILLGAGPGGGGGQIAGGLGGNKAPGTGTPGQNGAADQGGLGGGDFGFVGGGGGGGGYFGGGGGGGGSQTNDVAGGGGGGGSSFTAPGATGVVHQQGLNSGAGSVTISW